MLAPRGDVQHDTYYDYKSEDDTVFDMIAEMDEAQYNSICADTIDNFKNNMFDEQFDYCDDVELVDEGKISEETHSNDSIFNQEMSIENGDGNSVNCEISSVNSNNSNLNDAVYEVNCENSDKILDGINVDLCDDKVHVDQDVNRYVNIFSDISSDENSDELDGYAEILMIILAMKTK